MKTLLRDIYSMDAFHTRAERCDILLEDGWIKQIYAARKCECENIENIVDYNGNAVAIPGLINAHTHAAMVLFRGVGEELVLKDWLEKKIWPAESKLTAEHVYWGTKLACAEMLLNGVTSFADMYFFMDDAARAIKDTGIRASISRGLIGDRQKADKVIAESLKLAKDWSDGDKIVVMLAPHAPYTCELDLLQAVSSLAIDKKMGVHVHWLETEWEKDYFSSSLKKDPVSYLSETGLIDVPFLLLAHGVYLPVERLADIKRDNVTVVHNPSSNMKLGSGFAPIKEMFAEGINVALGTDGAASNNRLDMFSEMRLAAMIAKGWHKDPTILSAAQILKMATVTGANGIGLPDLGLLDEKKKADITIINIDQPHFVGYNADNLITHLIYTATSHDVKDVYIAGERIVKDGCLTHVDIEEIKCKASESMSELLR